MSRRRRDGDTLVVTDPAISQHVTRRFGPPTEIALVPTLVHHVWHVTFADRPPLALKAYLPAARTDAEVAWELQLNDHLVQAGAPVAPIVRDRSGDAAGHLLVDGHARVTVAYAWAPGAKPTPSPSTYELLGQAAARIHTAADTFPEAQGRDLVHVGEAVDANLAALTPLLSPGQRQQVHSIFDRVRRVLSDPALDVGVIHQDLTLDNIHREGDDLTVFDLDSAAHTWRATEPSGVLHFGDHWFAHWLTGYRSLRPFSAVDEAAVAAAVLTEDLRYTLWKLGLARSSRGTPLLAPADLPDVLAHWRDWSTARL